MADEESNPIQMVNSSNLARYMQKPVAVIPLESKSAPAAAAPALASLSVFAEMLPEASAEATGQMLAYIKLPEGLSPADCFARKDGFGGQLLSGFNKAGSLAQGSWTSAEMMGQMSGVASSASIAAALVMIEMQIQEIKGQLKQIDAGVSHIIERLDIKKKSDIEGLYERVLADYVARYDEYLADPEKLRAARIQIEDAITKAYQMWAEQRNTMSALGEHFEAKKKDDQIPHLKKDELEKSIAEFNDCELEAAVVFELACILDRVRMLYDRDASSARIAREKEHAATMLANYEREHDKTLSILVEAVKAYQGVPLALPAEDKVPKPKAIPQGVPEKAAQAAGQFFGRLANQTPWDAAEEQTNEEIDEMLAEIPSASASTLCEAACVKADSQLDAMSALSKPANAMLCDGDNIYLVDVDETELKLA